MVSLWQNNMVGLRIGASSTGLVAAMRPCSHTTAGYGGKSTSSYWLHFRFYEGIEVDPLRSVRYENRHRRSRQTSLWRITALPMVEWALRPRIWPGCQKCRHNRLELRKKFIRDSQAEEIKPKKRKYKRRDMQAEGS
jgi:hypothetical protein